ncbi:MAG: AsmA family protein [Elusimicrobia bacterium]|nr:AsmA family protein [Elusimicrobiota bacterium]
MVSKRKKIFFIIAGAIIVVVFAVPALLLNLNIFKSRIETAASKASAMDVQIKGGINVALFPHFAVSLKDVSVRNGKADIFSVKVIKAGLNLAALVHRKIEISRIALVKPVVSVVRYKNGTFNFKATGASAEKFAVEKISVVGGKLAYTDEKSGEKLQASGFNADIRSFSYSGADPLKNISFAADIKCKSLNINRFTLSNLVATISMASGVFDMKADKMSIFGGTGNATVHADMAEKSGRYQTTAVLNRFMLDELVKPFSPGNRNMEGAADFSADLTTAGNNAGEIKRSLNGVISLKGENIALNGMDIDGFIAKYEKSQKFNLVDAGAFALAGPFGPAVTKGRDFRNVYKESQGGKGVIKKLSSVWKIKNGVAQAADVALASKKNRIAVKGGLNFNNSRFTEITIAVLNGQGCAIYTQKVSGPFNKPQVSKVGVLKTLTGSVSNAAKKAWKFIRNDKSEKCAVFYSGSVAHP